MDVGFVDEEYRTLRLVGETVFDIGAAGDGSGGIVGIADVEDAGIRVGGDHSAHVVGIVLGQRHFDDIGATYFGGVHSGFVTWISSYIAAIFRGEGEDGIVQRLAGAGVGENIVRLEALGGAESVNEFLSQLEVIAAAFGNEAGHGGAGSATGAEGIFIGVDADGAGRNVTGDAAALSKG